MNRRSANAILAGYACALALALSPALARAQSEPNPCSRERASVRAPIELSLGAPGVPSLADFGSTPTPCAHQGFTVGGRLGLLIATSAFYGAIDAEASLSGTYRFDADSWLTLSVDAVRYRTVINASVVTAPIDLGASTLTMNHVLARDSSAQVTTFLRVLLPTELSNRYTARLGVEAGMSVVWSPHAKFALLGGLSLPVTAAVSAGGTHATFTPRATLDAAFRPVAPFEALLGVEARGSLDGVEYTAPRVALRLHFARVAFIDLSAMFPLGGAERALTRAALTFGMRW
jgi:hypothetical protein